MSNKAFPDPWGTRKSQEEPGGARGSQGEPGGPRKGQEDPGGPLGTYRRLFGWLILVDFGLCWLFR